MNPRPKGESKLRVAEQLFKYLETLPTGMDLDEIREGLKIPSKDKWLEENWGKEAYNKAKKSYEPKVEKLLRGEPSPKEMSRLFWTAAIP